MPTKRITRNMWDFFWFHNIFSKKNSRILRPNFQTVCTYFIIRFRAAILYCKVTCLLQLFLQTEMTFKASLTVHVCSLSHSGFSLPWKFTTVERNVFHPATTMLVSNEISNMTLWRTWQAEYTLLGVQVRLYQHNDTTSNKLLKILRSWIRFQRRGRSEKIDNQKVPRPTSECLVCKADRNFNGNSTCGSPLLKCHWIVLFKFSILPWKLSCVAQHHWMYWLKGQCILHFTSTYFFILIRQVVILFWNKGMK